MENLTAILIALIGAIAGIVGAVALIMKYKAEYKIEELNAKVALDKLIDERVKGQLKSAWSRLDRLSEDFVSLEKRDIRRTKAITRILRTIAKQWPGDVGPNLDPLDIDEIEETIPIQWIRR